MKNLNVKTGYTNYNDSATKIFRFLSSTRVLFMILASILIIGFTSCEQDDFNPLEKTENIIPESFRVEIPSSISSDVTLKTTSADTLKGNAIYQHLRTFIHVGDFGAEITQNVLTMIARYNLSQPMELTIVSDEDKRAKHLLIEENIPFEGNTWQYRMTVRDAEGKNTGAESDIALQVFWNLKPVKGIAIINLFNINRNIENQYLNTNFRVDYSEAGEMGYDKHMIVSLSGFPLPSPLVHPYALNKMKMFVGKKGDMVSVYGNSEHPNAKFFTSQTGFNWAFVAAASINKNISVAEVGLPPMNLDANNRSVLLEMYSIKNVFKNQILTVWPGINETTLDAWLYNTNAPGYFNMQGFVRAGSAPSVDYAPLTEQIKTLNPYNPSQILNLNIQFQE